MSSSSLKRTRASTATVAGREQRAQAVSGGSLARPHCRPGRGRKAALKKWQIGPPHWAFTGGGGLSQLSAKTARQSGPNNCARPNSLPSAVLVLRGGSARLIGARSKRQNHDPSAFQSWVLKYWQICPCRLVQTTLRQTRAKPATLMD